MSPSELFIGRFSDGIIIRLVGRGTMQQSPAVRAVVEHSRGARVVVFDATECDYFDSTFLGCLIWIKKACESPPARRFAIVAGASARIKLFATSSLDRYFDFLDESPEPLADWVPIDVQQLDLEALGRHVMRCHQLLADLGGDKAAAFRRVADRLAVELRDKASARQG
ncbi:MAG: STAS domain-containing protein [Pirellulales bacterium]